MASFIYYFLFLAALGTAIIGLLNFSSSERTRQYPGPEIARNAIATKKQPRLFMVVPKTKHRSAAKKAANSTASSTENADAQKNRRHKSRAGFSGGY
ncbi:MAG: hypothetical protein WAK55_02325 [Xanthobacteraceae bacterium]